MQPRLTVRCRVADTRHHVSELRHRKVTRKSLPPGFKGRATYTRSGIYRWLRPRNPSAARHLIGRWRSGFDVWSGRPPRRTLATKTTGIFCACPRPHSRLSALRTPMMSTRTGGVTLHTEKFGSRSSGLPPLEQGSSAPSPEKSPCTSSSSRSIGAISDRGHFCPPSRRGIQSSIHRRIAFSSRLHSVQRRSFYPTIRRQIGFSFHDSVRKVLWRQYRIQQSNDSSSI